MNDFTFYGDSWEHYTYWQMQDRKTLKKINELLEDIHRNGAIKGKGKPERLKYRPGYSRRITAFHAESISSRKLILREILE